VDLKEVIEISEKHKGVTTPDKVYYDQSKFSLLYRLMRSCPQPIIAAVHGPAMGGGLSLALASDIRLASEDAMFCAQYINIGLGGADLGSSYFLWRIVGWGKAAEMCLTGKRFYAEEALRIGLVNYVYQKKELMQEAMEIAKNMASKSKMALHLTKEALNASLNGISLEDAMRIEDRNQTIMGMMGQIDTEIKR
jgi:enoyl-CoA hydratase